VAKPSGARKPSAPGLTQDELRRGSELDYAAFDGAPPRPLARHPPRGPRRITLRRLRRLVCAGREVRAPTGTSGRNVLQHTPQVGGGRVRSRRIRMAVDFHRWLPWPTRQTNSRGAGQGRCGPEWHVGIMPTSTSASCTPDGAEVACFTWAEQPPLAGGSDAGRRHDEFNQLDQEWSQPPVAAATGRGARSA